jgi:hypothetical protein
MALVTAARNDQIPIIMVSVSHMKTATAWMLVPMIT